MLESVAIGLLTAGVEQGVEEGIKKFRGKRREHEFSPEVEELATEFNRSLYDAISTHIDASEYPELQPVLEDWTPVAKELDAIDSVAFETEEEAIKTIIEVVKETCGIDSVQNPELDRQLMHAVSTAYSDALRSFQSEITGTEQAQMLGFRSVDDLRDRVITLNDRLEQIEDRLEGRRYYHIFDTTAKDTRTAAGLLMDDRPAIDYFDRNGIPEEPPSDRVLITGQKGIGKTRLLIEYIDRIEAVDHIVIPRSALTDSSDIEVLTNEEFDGDVLLVWDDIHSVDPVTENRAVREAVLKLEDVFAAKDHSLYVMLTARSEELDQLPGDIRNPEGFWADYTHIELDLLDQEEQGKFTLQLYDSGVVESFDAGEIGGFDGTTPLGIIEGHENVLKDTKLDTSEIESAVSTSDIWAYQYQTFREDDRERAAVVDVIYILNDLDIGPTKQLIQAMYREVFGYNRPQDRFHPHLDALKRAGWFTSALELEHPERVIMPPGNDWETIYIQQSALAGLEQELNYNYVDLSEFFFSEIDEHIHCLDEVKYTADERWSWTITVTYLTAIKLRFIESLAGGVPRLRIDPNHPGKGMMEDNSGYDLFRFDPNEQRLVTYFEPVTPVTEHAQERVIDGFETLLAEIEDTPEIRVLYARYLMRFGKVEQARTLLKEIIDTVNDPPIVTHAYLGAIFGYQDDIVSASEHLNIVYQSWELSSELSFDFDLFAEYARILAQGGYFEEAKTVYEFIGEVEPETEPLTAEDLVIWGLALRDDGQVTEAKQRLRQALDRDPNHARAHSILGAIAASEDRTNEAKKRYEMSLELTDDDEAASTAAQNLAEIYADQGDYETAREYYREATERVADDASPALQWGLFEIEVDQRETAIDALETAINRRPDDREIRRTLVNVLLGPEGEESPFLLTPEELKIADEHLSYLFDAYNLADELSDKERVQNLSTIARRRILVGFELEGISEAREIATDIVSVISAAHVLRTTALTYGNIFYQPPMNKLATAYRLIINREYEAGTLLLEEVFEEHKDLEADDDFRYHLFSTCMHLIALSRLGIAEFDEISLKKWLDEHEYNTATAPYQSVMYLQDRTVDYRPSDFRYNAEVSACEVSIIPDEKEGNQMTIRNLERLTSAAILEEVLKEVEDSPFDDATTTALDRRPDPDANCSLHEIEGLGRGRCFKLRKVGIQSYDDLRRLSKDQLQQIPGIGSGIAETIKSAVTDSET